MRLACIAALACLAAPAAAAAGERADFSFGFAERTPGTQTAATAHIVYKPAPGQSKPSPIRRVVLDLPAGTGIERELPQCTASDEQLQTGGRSACEEDWLIGRGSLTAITGFGPPADPFGTDLWLFNSPEGLLELVQGQGQDMTLAVERGTLSGARLVFEPPTTPGGPPDGETAVSEIHWEIAGAAGSRPAWLTTPSGCPQDGAWRSTGAFTFADGVTAVVHASTPCSRAGVRRSPGSRMRLAIAPRRAAAGRATRFRFRVRAGTPRCRRGVRVRLAGKRVRTGRRGRAALVVALRRPGRRAAVARKRGCGRTRAGTASPARRGLPAPLPTMEGHGRTPASARCRGRHRHRRRAAPLARQGGVRRARGRRRRGRARRGRRVRARRRRARPRPAEARRRGGLPAPARRTATCRS